MFHIRTGRKGFLGGIGGLVELNISMSAGDKPPVSVIFSDLSFCVELRREKQKKDGAIYIARHVIVPA
jgi:hypothetical protein